jgi:hypothetical protein
MSRVEHTSAWGHKAPLVTSSKPGSAANRIVRVPPFIWRARALWRSKWLVNDVPEKRNAPGFRENYA